MARDLTFDCRKSNSSIHHRALDHRLLGYLAATGAAAITSTSAHAVVVCRELDQTVYGAPGTPGVTLPTTFDLDVDLDGTVDFIFSHGFQNVDNSQVDAAVQAAAGNAVDGKIVKAGRMTESMYVSPDQFAPLQNAKIASVLNGAEVFPTGWVGQSGFLGLRFLDENQQTHYGFVQMSVDPINSDTPIALRLDCVCYETQTDTQIHAKPCADDGNGAAVPEPAGLGALALGAIALAGLRRRRRVA